MANEVIVPIDPRGYQLYRAGLSRGQAEALRDVANNLRDAAAHYSSLHGGPTRECMSELEAAMANNPVSSNELSGPAQDLLDVLRDAPTIQDVLLSLAAQFDAPVEALASDGQAHLGAVLGKLSLPPATLLESRNAQPGKASPPAAAGEGDKLP